MTAIHLELDIRLPLFVVEKGIGADLGPTTGADSQRPTGSLLPGCVGVVKKM